MNTEYSKYMENILEVKRFSRRLYFQYIFEMGITAQWAQEEILNKALKAVISLPHISKLNDKQRHKLIIEAIQFQSGKYLEGIKQHTLKSFIFGKCNRIYV